MNAKTVVSLITGLEDAEKVVGDTTRGTACEGCPPLEDLVRRYHHAGGRCLLRPICFDAWHLDEGGLLDNAELGGTVPMWGWIGDEAANTFSY